MPAVPTEPGCGPAILESSALLREQPREQRRIRASYVDDLRPASRARDQRYIVTAHSESGRYRGQRCRRRFAVDGPLADPDNQSPVVLTADDRTGRARLDPDGDTHRPSVRRRAKATV
jgi:hypothetical protein